MLKPPSSPNKTENDDVEMLQFTVIMVDDEEYILRALNRIFRREPYRTLYTSTGVEGLKLLAETPDVAVIVSDQRMPQMRGSEFLARSREFAPDAIRMLLTGYSDKDATSAAMAEGRVSNYISKPFDDSMLLQIVRDGVRQFIENRHRQ